MEDSLRSVGKRVVGNIIKGSHFGKLIGEDPVEREEEKEEKKGLKISEGRLRLVEKTSPGPGDYQVATQSSPSFSKMGYGGIVNRAARFKVGQYKSQSPGPGAYDQPISNTKCISSVFAPTLYIPPEKIVSPAPGDYNTTLSFNSSGSVSSFKSKTKRLDFQLNDSPAPWQYSPVIPSSKSTAVLHKPLNLKRWEKNLYDPFAKPPQIKSTPGPGEYELVKNKTAIGISSVFAKQDVDRFGNPRVRVKRTVVPGPGSYHIETIQEKKDISHSFFKSTDPKIKKYNNSVPGPAYYSPKVDNKKVSFILNYGKAWV